MPNTFELISSYTATGSVSTISFTSIPATYTDLVILLSGRVDDTFGNPWYDTYLKVNSTAGTSRDLYGTGNAAASGTDSEIRILGIPSSGATASVFSNVTIYIPNYASTTTYKSISIDSVSENNATGSMAQLAAGLYSSNTAISSLTIDPYSAANFVIYSTAYLYGIKNS